jgi:hypothetical protein
MIKDNKMGGAWGIHGGREIHTDLWCGNIKERAHLYDLGVDGRIKCKPILKEQCCSAWAGLI